MECQRVFALVAAVLVSSGTAARAARSPDPVASFFTDGDLQATSGRISSHRHSPHAILLQQEEQQHQQQEPALSQQNMIIIGVAVTVLIVLGVAAFVFFRKKQAQESEEDACSPILKEDAAEDEPAAAEAPTLDDYETLFRKIAQKGAQTIGPKLAKGAEVRNIVEGKVASFQNKAKALVMSELNDAAGSVCKALEIEEGMLLLDMDAAVSANFPPASILLAGCLVPITLGLSKVSHIVQIVVVQLPVFCLALASEIMDWDHPCFAIPGIRLWAQCTGILTAVIIISRLIMYVRATMAENDLRAKSDEMREKLAKAESASAQSGGRGLGDLKELFVSHSTMLQYAVVVENRTRASIFNHIVGFGTLLWLFLIGWVVFITARYTFVPGIVAFHPAAADDPAYCEAWMTVIAARISVLLGVLFLFVNIGSVVGWLLETSLSTAGMQRKIENSAKEMDTGMMGLPVVQILVKAFLLRGATDVLSSRLAVAASEKSELAQEYDDTLKRLEALKAQMESKQQEQDTLATEIEASGGTLDLSSGNVQQMDLDALKQQGKDVIEERRLLALQVEEATTEQIERLVEKLRMVAQQFEESETVQAAKKKAQEAADRASAAAYDAADQIQNSEQFQQAQAMLADPELMQKAQAAAQEQLAQAQTKAAEMAEMATDPEMQKKAQEALAQAKEKLQALEAQAEAMANDPELMEKAKAAAAEAGSAAQATAEAGAEKAKATVSKARGKKK